MSSDTITGRVIAGRYQITGYLRPGRMGDIYVARRTDDNERVSIKLLDPALFGEDEAVRRFERETRVMRGLRHSCSMKVLDFGRTEEGYPWMALEYVEGELLSEVLEEQGALGAARAARIAGQVALALEAAHRLGVVHRDLSPENVLLADVGGDERVKVREFGLSRLQKRDEESTLTAVGVRIGTPTYMAPEYIEDFALDHRADLYALGVVLFEMLVGAPPFQGRPYKVMDMHLTAAVPRPSSQADGVPGWLDELVLTLMAKDPEHRPQRAADVAATIEERLGEALEAAQPPAAAPEAPPAPPPVQRAVPEVDPILVNLVKQNTLSLSRGAGAAPKLRDCLLVERVAATSVASAAGVRPGYLLELPDEPARGLRSTTLHHPVVRQRRYVFSSPDGGERIELVATGMPVGVDVVRTAAHVRAFFGIDDDPSALVDLWKQRDWEGLEKLAWRVLAQQRSTGLFSKLLGTERIVRRAHPALVMYGAALLEQGKAGGRELVEEYRSQHAASWPVVYNAIAHYYLGRERARRTPDQTAVDLLWQSYVLWPLEATAVALETIVHRRPEHRAWFQRTFPEYSMDTVDGTGSARLSTTLEEMDSAKLLIVCMMGGFRGSLDYDAFMHRFLSYGAWFHELVHELHVVTTQTRREEDKPDHYRGEDLVVRAGLRVRILEDYRAFVQRAVKPGVIPTVYAVDKGGKVVHEGHLHEVDMWDALALAGRMRMERLRRG